MSINSLTNLINQTVPYAWDNSLSMMEFLGKIVTSMNQVIVLVNEKLPEDFETAFYAKFREYTQAEMSKIIANGQFQTILESIITGVSTFQNEIVGARDGQPNLKANLDRAAAKVNMIAQKTQNSPGTIEQMLENAQSYLDNKSMLVYGNAHTAYDGDVQPVNGKNEIDCSSFVSLMIHGVPYDKSRYAGNFDNINDPRFFNEIDSYSVRYANELAKFGFDNGYAFIPKPDMSNVQAGDVLFLSWNSFTTNPSQYTQQQIDFHNAAFMKIDHNAIYLQQNNANRMRSLQFDLGISSIYHDAHPDYYAQAVLACRFPFANMESKYKESNVLSDGYLEKSTSSSWLINEYTLEQNLEKGRHYTMILSQTMDSDYYYLIQTPGGISIYNDTNKIGGYNNHTILRFLYLGDEVTNKIRVGIGSHTGNPVRVGTVHWVSLLKGFKVNKQYYIKNDLEVNQFVFPLAAGLVTDLNTGYKPNYNYSRNSNTLVLSLNLPFNTGRTGNLVLGTLPHKPRVNQRMNVNVYGALHEVYAGVLEVNTLGVVTLFLYDAAVTWKTVSGNGTIFL